ncbi:hypothetical protein MXB_3212, partial [Myxobolus squamalis]
KYDKNTKTNITSCNYCFGIHNREDYQKINIFNNEVFEINHKPLNIDYYQVYDATKGVLFEVNYFICFLEKN